MGVPDLNVRFGLEMSERSPDGLGGHTTHWRHLGWLWGRMEARSGREQATGAGMISVVQWRIKTRAAPAGDLRRPRPGQRMRLGARLFLIEAVAESDAAGRFLNCFAREEDQG